jgi:glycosyltransferase involved in cell wall biosynthesis
MKILIVNHYSGSAELGMEYRHYYLAKELQSLGHDVRIVASRFSHLRMSQPDRRLNGWSEHCGIPHLWLAGCRYRGNGARRVLNMLGFADSLWRKAPGIAKEQKPDVVLTSSPHPFSAYGAARLARLAGARFIFEIRDLWPLSLMELGSMSARNPLIRMLDHAEAYGCRHADKVVSLLPCVHRYMRQREVPEDKWVVIPNGVLLSEWTEPWADLSGGAPEVLADLRAQGLSIVGYAGTHGFANALHVFLDEAKRMAGEKVAFVLAGGGLEKAGLQRRAQAEGLRNVWFLDAVRKEQIPMLLQWFDVAYVGLHRQPLYRFGIAPNKLSDYMMAGRPVLMAGDSGNDAVSEAGCGLTVKPEDPQAVAHGIRTLLALSEDERKAMGRRGREFALKNHTYAVLAQKFLTACANSDNDPGAPA